MAKGVPCPDRECRVAPEALRPVSLFLAALLGGLCIICPSPWLAGNESIARVCVVSGSYPVLSTDWIAAISGSSTRADSAAAIYVQGYLPILLRDAPLPGCSSNGDCDQDRFCHKQPGDCTGQGVCAERPWACTDVWDPVCGCDGRTYSNICYAASVGVSVHHVGPCQERSYRLGETPKQDGGGQTEASLCEECNP